MIFVYLQINGRQFTDLQWIYSETNLSLVIKWTFMDAQKGLIRMNQIYPRANERSLRLFVNIKQISAHAKVKRRICVCWNICSYTTAWLNSSQNSLFITAASSPDCTLNDSLHTLIAILTNTNTHSDKETHTCIDCHTLAEVHYHTN